MKVLEINNLDKNEKVELLKLLVDDLDIVLTACYGATGYITSDSISIWDRDDDWELKRGMVVISTNIMTG